MDKNTIGDKNSRSRPDIHERLATVTGGKLDGWVVVARGTLREFAQGRVGGYRIDADKHCTNKCTGQH